MSLFSYNDTFVYSSFGISKFVKIYIVFVWLPEKTIDFIVRVSLN